MSEKVMRESVNQVNIEGYVNANNIVTKVDKHGKELITGSIDIAVDENNIIPVQVFSYKFKKDNTESKVYKSLLTVMNEYKDATMVEGGYLNADRVKVSNGTIRTNEFLTKQGTVGQSIKYSTNFLNRSTDAFKPQAKFNIEIIVKGLRPETKDEEETGRGFIEGMYVDYEGKLQPISLVAEGTKWTKMESNIDLGSTMVFWGDIQNRLFTKTTIVEADYGDDREVVQTFTVKERVIEGARVVEDDFAYDMKDFKKGLVDYAERLELLKTAPRINEQQPPTTTSGDSETSAGEEEKYPWE